MIRDPEFRVPVIQICRVLGVSRATVDRHVHPSPEDARLTLIRCEAKQVRDADVVDRCVEVRKAHPLWGYRRTWANIRFRQGIKISLNRVHRIMKEHGLLQGTKRFKPQRPWRAKIRAERPHQYWGTDMSKAMIPGYGWLYFVVVIDWFTKVMLGLSVGMRGDADLWLKALNEATLTAFPADGVRGKAVSLISDNGSQPTSRKYMADCATLTIEQIFTTYDNPKGNADTERVIRTTKEEALWPYEHETPMAAETKLRATMSFYNSEYCHSSLGYLSPMEFQEAFLNTMTRAA